MSQEAAEFVEVRLRTLVLPALVRPPIPAGAAPTVELVYWGIREYAYSLIAHIRTILRGIVLLAESGNGPTLMIVCRHIYEWNMQSSYAFQNFEAHLQVTDLKRAWDLYLTLSTGNAWVKSHGAKYAPEISGDELETSIRIKHFAKAYKSQQIKTYGSENVDDDYSYLSEHSHPNGFCLQPYVELNPPEVRFVEAPASTRLPGILHACLIEWLMTMHNILGLAQDVEVRSQLAEILRSLVIQVKGAANDEKMI
jgi:hypothetical protein